MSSYLYFWSVFLYLHSCKVFLKLFKSFILKSMQNLSFVLLFKTLIENKHSWFSAHYVQNFLFRCKRSVNQWNVFFSFFFFPTTFFFTFLSTVFPKALGRWRNAESTCGPLAWGYAINVCFTTHCYLSNRGDRCQGVRGNRDNTNIYKKKILRARNRGIDWQKCKRN